MLGLHRYACGGNNLCRGGIASVGLYATQLPFHTALENITAQYSLVIYFVRYTGYDESTEHCLDEKDLNNAWDILREYKWTHRL